MRNLTWMVASVIVAVMSTGCSDSENLVSAPSAVPTTAAVETKDNIVWGSSKTDNIVWGSGREKVAAPSDLIIWGD